MESTYASFDHLLMNGSDGIEVNDSKHTEYTDDGCTGTSHHDDDEVEIQGHHHIPHHHHIPLGDLMDTHPTTSDEAESADDVVTKLLKENRQQMGDDVGMVDTDDLHDPEEEEDDEGATNRRHRQEHAELIQQLAEAVTSSSPSSSDHILLKEQQQHQQHQHQQQQQLQQQQNQQQEDELAAVVNRQLSASFGDGPDYDNHNMNLSLNIESLQSHHHHLLLHQHEERHDDTSTNDRSMLDMVTSTSMSNGSTVQNGQLHPTGPAETDNEEDDFSTTPPRICRICHKMDDRPVLRFAPVEYDMNVVTAAPLVQTFPLEICVHVFCGKTASILPNVNQPEYEILTKAGIKNKHGIGGEVNAALSRTRCATLPTDASNGKEKQFFLVREFEAHLAAVRGYLQSNQQHQQQQHPHHLSHPHHHSMAYQNQYNSLLSSMNIPPSAPLAPPQLQQPHVAANGLSNASHGVLNATNTFLQAPPLPQSQSNLLQPQPMSSSSSTSASHVMASAVSTPTTSVNNPYSQLLQRLNNPTNGSTNSSNSTMTLTLGANNIMGSPSQQQQQHQQQPPTLSNLLLNSVNSLDQIYSSSIGNSNDNLNLNQSSCNGNNTGSPTLEQLELILQQQQQIQQQQNSSVASTLLANQNNYTSTVSTGNKKTIPAKAGNTTIKYQSPQVHAATANTTAKNNSNNSSISNTDFKIYCECGGTHLSTHTTKGIASYKNHLSTKRHQKYMNDQEKLRLAQVMSAGNSSSSSENMIQAMTNHNNTSSGSSSATNNNIIIYSASTLLGQNPFSSSFMDTSSNNNNSHASDNNNNNNGGNSSCNSSVYGAAV